MPAAGRWPGARGGPAERGGDPEGAGDQRLGGADGAVALAVEVAGTGVAQALAKRPGVIHVTPTPATAPDRVALTVTANRANDLRPEIFGLAKARGWTLYELHQQAGSLESLFQQLTSAPEQAS